jgi:hypothetical protein
MCLRFFLSFSFLLVLNSCTSVPVANTSWINSNCQGLGYTVYDINRYSNCTRSSEGTYSCNMSDGIYKGKLKEGKKHGIGTYTWKSGRIYKGEWKDGRRWCGIEQSSNDFWTYKNGKSTYGGQAGVDWGAVAAGVLIVGAAYAVADAASDSGGSSSRSSSPKKCSYTLNSKTIRIDNPNYTWGSCPSSHTYKEPLMCKEASSYASPKCGIGKACGGTCISAYDTCHVGRGSACNNNYRSYP